MVATQIFVFNFHLENWGDDPIWRIYFSDVLVKNHQPEMFLKILVRRILHPSQTRHMRQFLSPIKQRSPKRSRWKNTLGLTMYIIHTYFTKIGGCNHDSPHLPFQGSQFSGVSTFSFVLGMFHVERKGTLSISPTIGQASVLSSVDGLPTFYGASNQCRVVKIPWIF